jgi:hypothetical protein
LLAAATVPVRAQTVDIVSEFQRLDPFGAVAPADRAWRQREILSPAVARNGHASFHVAVSIPQGQNYLLYVVTNPVDACRVSLYREHFVKSGDQWIPDKLQELTRLPDFGVMPDPDEGIEGQTTRLYLLDVWIPPDASPGRFRLEVQLKMGDWTIRPLEIRVTEALYPDLPAAAAGVALAGVNAPADAFAVSGWPGQAPAPPDSVRAILYRNGLQDAALARAGGVDLRYRAVEIWRFNSLFARRPWGAEWYLKVRDFLVNR